MAFFVVEPCQWQCLLLRIVEGRDAVLHMYVCRSMDHKDGLPQHKRWSKLDLRRQRNICMVNKC